MKSPITYYGGKQSKCGLISPHIKPHTVYGEPYCGGASLFFYKKIPTVGDHQFYREVLNDLDGLLVNFYRIGKRLPESLAELIVATPYSRQEYDRALEICRQPIHDELLSAWAYFVNINMSFSSRAVRRVFYWRNYQASSARLAQ